MTEIVHLEAADLEAMARVRDWVRLSCSLFRQHDVHFGHGTDNVWDEAIRLVFGALHLPAEGDDRLLDATLLFSERLHLLDLLRRRVEAREPVPYLLGEGWFMGLPFHIDSNVLIPRSHLGELLANELEPWVGGQVPGHILDLCCGSGCIGVAAAMTFPDAVVVLSDISQPALALAKRNVERYSLTDAHVIHSDLFENLGDYRGQFDVILCNPPYVDAEDMADLPPEYAHEPELALASGEDGLDFTRRLLREAPEYLSADGILVCEIGNSLPRLLEAFPKLSLVIPELEASPEDERGTEGVFIVSREQLLNFEG
ncbi:50S ribosomal protein L3 N(5)-glutamine methyltransferase [Allohahella marinimesophila]|uniref:50S ribosomal protein L3 N(5)-glutamine methyltransferase n=1 Tax=Allohahella marinimesophila TaxID=1054972 RepID=A0ABP7NVG0_9GAMM